jgi:hypothetical protein
VTWSAPPRRRVVPNKEARTPSPATGLLLVKTGGHAFAQEP